MSEFSFHSLKITISFYLLSFLIMESVNNELITLNSDSSSNEPDFPFKIEIDERLKEKLQDIPEALDYIKKLEKLIKRHLKKINKLRNKLKIRHKSKDAGTQTDCFEESAAKHSGSNSGEDSHKTLADDIKEAAEIAMQKTGFVYEETSGLYYDYNTGYYYNAEYGLYYDGNTGQYLQYNAETQTYDFHSQTSLPVVKEVQEKNKRKKKQRQKTKDNKKARKHETDSGEVEDGECSSSERSSAGEEEESKSETGDISKSWPPCIRIIVESSEIQDLKVGSLHIITCSGGTIGREGQHSILLKDPNASKHHLKITFDKGSSQYQAIDLGSRNGTLLNGKRMSSSKQESEALTIAHGSKIQIGQTVFLCHVHDGSQTCGHCEPGLIQTDSSTTGTKIEKNTRSDRHKKELNNLKMLYGVSSYYEDDLKLASGYTDRAQKRRDTVGSQNPHEKTQVASVDESINKENKGFKLLSKMGWKEGQSLGKTGEGLLEPINSVSNKGTTGLGSAVVMPMPTNTGKQIVWKKAKERFQKLPESNDVFDE